MEKNIFYFPFTSPCLPRVLSCILLVRTNAFYDALFLPLVVMFLYNIVHENHLKPFNHILTQFLNILVNH